MTNLKVWIGMMMFMVLATMACNVLENNDMIMPDNVAEIQALTEHSSTTSVSSTGESVTFIDKSWGFVSRLVLFDYSVFKQVDPNTGEITDHPLVVIRYLLICIGVGLIIDLFIIARRVTLG